MEHLFKKIQNAPHGGVFVFLWSFIFGILFSSFIKISPLVALFIVCIGVIIVLGYKQFILLGFLCIALGLGIFRFDIKNFHEVDQSLEQSIGREIEVRGMVVNEPEQRENDVRFVVQTETDKIIVTSPFINTLEYGDEASIKGKLEKPGIIKSDTGRDFDYSAYLSKDDVYYTMIFGKVSVTGHDKGNKILSVLLRVKHSFVREMNNVLPEPESSLLAGLLVSGKQALPKNILEEFKRAGVVHIVVLSGYNITIVAEFLRNIFSFLSFTFATGASVMGIIFFTLMTGATATVVRASIMALIVVLGKSLHRTYSVPRALLVAACLMLLQNPKLLIFDPSFQLSFLAILALVYVGPIVELKLKKVSEKWGIRSILSTTIATQITVLPYLLYSMGNVSLVSLFSNMLILIFVPTTMLVGFVATFLGFLNYYLALPFAYTAHLLLSYILGVAHILGNLSWASITLSIPLWLMLVSYISIGGFIWRFQNSSHTLTNSNS
ncbi:hypothetical protein BH11PAT3_BH11PAT3_0220 [soil metagenome]